MGKKGGKKKKGVKTEGDKAEEQQKDEKEEKPKPSPSKSAEFMANQSLKDLLEAEKENEKPPPSKSELIVAGLSLKDILGPDEGRKSRPSLSKSRQSLSKSKEAVDKTKKRSRISFTTKGTRSAANVADGGASYESSSTSTSSEATAKEVKPEKKVKEGKGGKKEKKEGDGGKKEKKEGEEGAEAEKKEGKKGKKDKKKKKVVVEEVKEEAEPVVDVMAEIMKLKALAERNARKALGEEVSLQGSIQPSIKSEKGKKEKGAKGPKKKLSKKEKLQLQQEMAEQARIRAEEEAIRAAEELRLLLIQLEKEAIAKEKREQTEAVLRVEQLQLSCAQIQDVIDFKRERALAEKAAVEWKQYLKCDGLPNPADTGQMTTYLHLWDMAMDETDMEQAAIRTTEVLKLLDVLDDLITEDLGADDHQIEQWKWVRLLFRQHQQESLDMATYRLLRNVNKNLKRVDIPTADYKHVEKDFSLALWLRVQLPTPHFNPRRPPKPRIEIDFPDMKMSVLFPITLTAESMAIRGMYLDYDHVSDLAKSYNMPPLPELFYQDLLKITNDEWRAKLKYKYENSLPPPAPNEERVDVDALEEIPIVPYQKLEPTASTFFITKEDETYAEIRENLLCNVDEGELNLRKYRIVGGIYFLDLFYQPSQPQELVTFDMTVTQMRIPKRLEEVPFYIPYTPPPPVEAGVRRAPEEIEEEVKQQEAELEKLTYITLTLPDRIMWFDVPVICHWDKEEGYWSTKEIHDLKHIEEKGYVTFRTGVFGRFAVAAYRYVNFPFQAWEVRPEVDGTITINIAASILVIDFNVKDNQVCISQLQNSPNDILQDIVGVYYSLPKLIRIMRAANADLFPDFDAFCYIDGTCEKHWPMEKHVYYCMARLCVAYNFAWSRWNLQAGRRSIVMQMREYKPDKAKQPLHSMLLITPLNALYVDCTEVSQTFIDEGIEGMKFYADLFHLAKSTSGMSTRTKVHNAPFELVNTVADLLIATRVLSFS